VAVAPALASATVECAMKCGRMRRSGHLMCLRCWGMVPFTLQCRILAAWKARQINVWLAAVRAAMKAVRAQEVG